MRFVVIVAILFATGCSVNGWNIKEVTQFTKFKLNGAESPLKDRQVRAATSCEGAYQETLTPQFQECLGYLSVDDGEEYSPKRLDSFCNQLHCPRTIGPVYRDIAVLCDENVSACIHACTVAIASCYHISICSSYVSCTKTKTTFTAVKIGPNHVRIYMPAIMPHRFEFYKSMMHDCRDSGITENFHYTSSCKILYFFVYY